MTLHTHIHSKTGKTHLTPRQHSLPLASNLSLALICFLSLALSLTLWLTLNHTPLHAQPAPGQGALIATKRANVSLARVGDTILYTYQITNTGNVPLSAIHGDDDRLGPIDGLMGSLPVGHSRIATATYTIQPNDLPGPLVNIVTVSGLDPNYHVITTTATATVQLTTDTNPVPAALGDYVWIDHSRNNLQDTGDSPASGISVHLLNTSDQLLATDITDANGYYLFENLTPAIYRIRFIIPSGYTLVTPQIGGDPATDSDAIAEGTSSGKTSDIDLAAGEVDLTWDAGLIALTSLQTAALGDRVWLDINANGRQDSGEAGAPGVTVHLLGDNNQVLATAITNGEGLYLFENLPPATYRVHFILPTGYAFTSRDTGSDDRDSDAAPDTGKTGNIDLAAAETDLTWDAGLITLDEPPVSTLPAALGDYVWHDEDRNGLQDASETGVPNTTVHLYRVSSNPILDSELISTTTTNAQGLYWFGGLAPGSYFVEFIPPPAYALTTPNVQNNSQDTRDSDAIVPNLNVAVSDGAIEPKLGGLITYTITISNPNLLYAATNSRIATSVPSGTTFIPNASTPAWACNANATSAGTPCYINLIHLPAGANTRLTFVVQLASEGDSVPEIIDLEVELINNTAGRSHTTTLAAGAEDPTLDAGLFEGDQRVASGIRTPRDAGPTDLPTSGQPSAPGNSRLFLPGLVD